MSFNLMPPKEGAALLAKSLLALGSFLVLSAGTANAQNLVVNGSFEANPIPPENGEIIGNFPTPDYADGWVTESFGGSAGLNTTGGAFLGSQSVPDGANVLWLQQNIDITQSVAGFQSGLDYTLRMSVNKRPGFDDPAYRVTVNGTELVGETLVTSEGWQAVEVDFASPGQGSFDLVIEGIRPNEPDDSTLLVDAISIVEQGDPDPFAPPESGWPIQVVRIPTGQPSPTIDGSVDVENEWSVAGESFPVDLRLGTLNTPSPYFPDTVHNGTMLESGAAIESDADASAVFYFLYDENALYMGVIGRDDVFIDPGTPGQPNTGDAIQLGLDFDGIAVSNGNTSGKIYIPSWSLTENTNDSNFFNAFWPESSPNPMTGTTWAVSVDSSAGTYELEARIPWSALTAGGDTFDTSFPPPDGHVAKALPIILDRDEPFPSPGTAAFLYTAGGGANVIIASELWSDFIFTEDPVSPPIETSVGDDWLLYH